MLDEPFKPYPWSLRVVVGTNFYEVPVYQRPYTWSSSEVDSLLDDIFSSYRNRAEQPDGCFFAGQLFLRKQGKGSDGVKDKYEVVDGQQRLATFSMILISVLLISTSRGFQKTSKDISDLCSYLWKYSNEKYNKEERLLTLSSIDKDFFSFLFDTVYSSLIEPQTPIGTNAPNKIKTLIEKYSTKCWTENNLRSMFFKVYQRIEKEIPQNDGSNNEILHFLNYLMDKTLFIAIQSSIDMPHVFSVFESINSKGKPLDDIDKIKTYIFSVLDESDYNVYLTKWGQLIIKTDDQLEDYLQIYIKAYLFFYRQKINLKEFQYIARQLPSRFGVSSQKEALKRLIDGMLDKVEQYALLGNEKEADKLVAKPEFVTFYRLFMNIGYSHPRALFFRAFCELSNKGPDGVEDPLISKSDVSTIVKAATLFMFKFQSIKGGDSKDAIPYFESIGRAYYGKPNLDSAAIKKTFSDALIKEGVDKTIIRSSFVSMDFYSKHDLAYSVLSLLESIDQSNGNKLLFSQASMMLSHIKDKTFDIDHMLPQNPDQSDDKLKYFCDSTSGTPVLVLKDGHDFPTDSVLNGMKYDEFESLTINRIGNIRLLLPQLNEGKGNEICHLPNHEEFTTYGQITDRCSKMASLLFDSPDLN
jgi:uncharacterized protein with ParB-like and HNH nuclease domain